MEKIIRGVKSFENKEINSHNIDFFFALSD